MDTVEVMKEKVYAEFDRAVKDHDPERINYWTSIAQTLECIRRELRGIQQVLDNSSQINGQQPGGIAHAGDGKTVTNPRDLIRFREDRKN